MAIALIPALYRRYALEAAMFGSADDFETVACVCAMLTIALTFAANAGYILKMRGHLVRDRHIMEEYTSLLLGTTNKDDPIARIQMTAHNVRVWGRGREAMFSFEKCEVLMSSNHVSNSDLIINNSFKLHTYYSVSSVSIHVDLYITSY